VRVLRGVRLPRFAHEGHVVEIELDGDVARLRLAGDPTPAYEMRVDRAPWRSGASGAAAGGAAPRAPRPGVAPVDLGAIYDRLLFHGPRFAVVDAIDGASTSGMIARVRGVHGARWPRGFVTDVAALDAALQVALLWARTSTGGAYLPTSIERVELHGVTSAPSLECVLSARGPADLRAIVDVDLVGVASLRGVNVHRLPDDNAFAPSTTTSRAVERAAE